MKFTWRSELPALAVLVMLFALAAWAWPGAPERMPVHWGLGGAPDRWGGKWEGLLLLPTLAVGFYLVFLVLPSFDPGRANYPRFAGAYFAVRLAVLGMFAAIHAAMLAAARHPTLDMNLVMLPAAGVMLMIVGNLMGKLRPNWFIGVRTPWTLSSKRSWDRTHRAAGWACIACGALFIAAGAVQRPWAGGAALAALMACALGLVVYSWRVWSTDPDRVPPAGTSPAEDADVREP